MTTKKENVMNIALEKLLWLVPHKLDLAGTIGLFTLDVIVGGLIGGFALVWQVITGLIATIKG